jgi:hypothetical protein
MTLLFTENAANSSRDLTARSRLGTCPHHQELANQAASPS